MTDFTKSPHRVPADATMSEAMMQMHLNNRRVLKAFNRNGTWYIVHVPKAN